MAVEEIPQVQPSKIDIESAANYAQPETISELDTLIQAQYRKYTELANVQPVNSYTLNDQPMTADVTFAGPISMEDFADLLGYSGADSVKYQAKFLDDTGTWWTVSSTILNERALVEAAKEMIENAGKTFASYEGITYAKLEFEKTEMLITSCMPRPLCTLLM